jgi:pilus assembly protein CpaF
VACMSDLAKKPIIQKEPTDWRQESGPLKIHLVDPTITEIMINRWDRVFIERGGIIEESSVKFNNPDQLWRFVQAISVIVKRELNNRYPFLDARLPDGSRLNVVIPPLSLDGPSLTIRKFNPKMVGFQQLIEMGVIDEKAVFFLNQAVKLKQNIIISGGTGSGKTTLLNILSSFISSKERVVTIEDTAELQVNVKNLVRMETRPQLGSEPPITMHQLLKNALRMRPDRIVIGECRSIEAWDMLVAMNTGHEGSLTTLHANSAADALRRLESMIMQTGLDAPRAMIQEDISKTISLIIQTERAFDGQRRIVEIIEVQGRTGDDYNVATIFQNFDGQGFKSTGVIPKFIEQPRAQKHQFPNGFFNPEVKIRLAG